MTSGAAPLGDHALARSVATHVGELLLSVRADLFDRFGEASAMKDAADALAQEAIAERLSAHRPADAILSEEAPDDRTRLSADRVWIVDPLDGTREYARRGKDDWAVHVALWERGSGLTAGAVALPAQGVVLATDDIAGPGEHRIDGPVRVVVSGSRTPHRLLEQLAAAMPIEVRTWGSAGAKAALVITGEVDLYVHDGALNEWDAAAPVAVAAAAGLLTVALDGSPLLFNQHDTVTGSLLMGTPLLVERVVTALTR